MIALPGQKGVSPASQCGLLSLTAGSLMRGNESATSHQLERLSLRRLTEINQKISPTLSLPDWQRHDATDVIRRAPLLLGEVPDKFCSILVNLCHDIEEKRLDVVVEGLVIEKHFGD